MIDVERTLEELGRQLDYPSGDDLAAAVRARLGAEATGGDGRGAVVAGFTRRRIWWAVAAAAVTSIIIAVVLPAPREGLARWFGIGGVRLERSDAALPADIGSDLDLGAPATADEAAAVATFVVTAPTDLGPPGATFTGRPPGAVTMVWAPSAELPEVDGTGVALLLTEFPGSTTDTLVHKELRAGTRVEQVEVDGHDGYWITGAPHVVHYLDPTGSARLDSTRLAGNTLLWQVDGVTHRMESALDLEAMLDLASSLRPVR